MEEETPLDPVHNKEETVKLHGMGSRKLHGDKKSSLFPPHTQCFVPITAATVVILLKMSLLPRLPHFIPCESIQLIQCKFINSCSHYRRYLGKSENPFPITAVYTTVTAGLPRSGNTVQVSNGEWPSTAAPLKYVFHFIYISQIPQKNILKIFKTIQCLNEAFSQAHNWKGGKKMEWKCKSQAKIFPRSNQCTLDCPCISTVRSKQLWL